MEGRAATERSHDRSQTNEAAAVTDVEARGTVSSVNIGIDLY
jgi:hypothetical protein